MKIRTLLLAGALVASPAAWASNCPNLVKEIDGILESKANVDEETVVDEDLRKQVKALRDEGQRLHEEGKHDESVETLEKALEMLKGETG